MIPARKPISIFLAEDDDDDCLLFQEAIQELPMASELVIVRDGQQLMEKLHVSDPLPGVLFLDINMPKKTGTECLIEIKQNEKLQQLSVIILSTSFDREVVKQLYNNGACYYLRKPTEFSELKLIIQKSLMLLFEIENTSEEFVLNP